MSYVNLCVYMCRASDIHCFCPGLAEEMGLSSGSRLIAIYSILQNAFQSLIKEREKLPAFIEIPVGC